METNEMRLEALDLNQQANMLIKAGNYEAAKGKLDKAIDLDPMLVDSYRNYGDLCMGVDAYKDAKNYYKKALLVERVPVIYFLCGNACFMNDEVHEGLEYYNMAISAGYDSDEMMFFMGLAYEHLNDDRMALRYFQRACAKNPSRPDYLVKRIAALVRLDMLENAEEEIDNLLRVAPEMYDGYHLKTHMLLNKGEIEAAVKFSKQAVDRFPSDADLMFDHIRCVSMTKDFDAALKLLGQAKQMKYYSESERAFLILEAQIYAEKNNFAQAAASCEACIATEDGEFFAGEARFLLMNFELTQKKFESALNQAEAIVTKSACDSFYHAALYYKAFLLKQLNREEEAHTAYKHAIILLRMETLKNPSAIDVYLYRAMAHKDMEDYDKALEILEFVLGLNAEVAEVYALKAEIYTALGNHAQSDEQRKKAYELKPELKPTATEVGE